MQLNANAYINYYFIYLFILQTPMGILMWVGRDFEIITTWTLSYNVKQLQTYVYC